MAIIQPAFEISEQAMAGLLSGDLVRHGGVIYNATGGIFEHLKDVSLPETESGALVKAVKILKKPQTILIGLGAVAVGVGIALYAHSKSKQKRSEHGTEIQAPKWVETYNASLCAYLDAIRNGNMSIDIIARLMAELDEMKINSDSRNVTIQFSIEQFDTLVNLVFDYTRKLAEANSVEFNISREPVSSENAIVDLQCYLEIQKQIFENAA
ncbi:hypothetical protein [Desulfosporosinus youngiae]|uniref:Uncharacterized protein n=1 Tax=Desulfosporosinus youngiae DSM 17734 TaxID=768710 RepID=H5XYY4_9FIRM|nr:hypothetical protein [Desulfosporosinus youngiae]EHQ91690.1 hypothetical protein DesyoDRAFT_4746 [Desulfosporosinus youngiae DSM 17734]